MPPRLGWKPGGKSVSSSPSSRSMSGWTKDWCRLPFALGGGDGGGGGEEVSAVVLRFDSIVVEKRLDRNDAEKCLLAMHRPLETIWAAIMMISSRLRERPSKRVNGMMPWRRGGGIDTGGSGRFE